MPEDCCPQSGVLEMAGRTDQAYREVDSIVVRHLRPYGDESAGANQVCMREFGEFDQWFSHSRNAREGKGNNRLLRIVQQ